MIVMKYELWSPPAASAGGCPFVDLLVGLIATFAASGAEAEGSPTAHRRNRGAGAASAGRSRTVGLFRALPRHPRDRRERGLSGVLGKGDAPAGALLTSCRSTPLARPARRRRCPICQDRRDPETGHALDLKRHQAPPPSPPAARAPPSPSPGLTRRSRAEGGGEGSSPRQHSRLRFLTAKARMKVATAASRAALTSCSAPPSSRRSRCRS
jgi:hypothetical protein